MKRSVIIISLLAVLLASCRSHKTAVISPAPGTELPSGRQSRPVKGDMTADVDPVMGRKLVVEARRWLGTPYRYGGESKAGTDCSGMLMVIYRDVAGLKLPRNSSAQHDYCIEIEKRRLQPGDLVFFSSSKGGRKISHVGMYVGNGRIIHASSSRGVIESDLAERYYDSHYHSSGRVYGISLAATGGKPAKGKKRDNETDAGTLQPETAGWKQTEPVRNTAPVRTMTLDEFIEASRPQTADPTAVREPEQRSGIKADTTSCTAGAGKQVAPAEIMPDTVKYTDPTDSVQTDTVPVVQPLLGPQVKVDGHRCPAHPQPMSCDSVAADSVRRADDIRSDVAKAMKFGK